MADGSLSLDFGQELVVDLFAGGGGASLGMERAYRAPDVAVNHNAIAIGVHQANHSRTQHYIEDVFKVDPREATGGRPVAVLWASPDCRHHSKAKGGKPRSKKIRGLAWVVVKWASALKPRLIHLENVEEFADWGPLLKDGSPCKVRKGMTFRRWVRQLEKLGYRVEHRELVAADYGAPTIRKRLYVIARCDGRPIVWPNPTHAKVPTGKLKPWRTAAECIDFDLPAQSIFDRPKPLAVNTQKRIAKGLWRYVLNCADPFIVHMTHHGERRQHPLTEPLPTVTAAHRGEMAMCAPALTPFLTEHANASNQRVFPANEPLRTQVAQVKGGHFALVAPTLVQTGYGEREGQEPRALDLAKPLGTVVAGGVKHALVASHITKFRANSIGSAMDAPLHTVTAGGNMARPAGAAHAMGLVSACLEQANGGFYDGDGRDTREPLSTICTSGANQRLIAAYFVKYYGTDQDPRLGEPLHTVTTKDRFGVVEVIHVPADVLAPEHRRKAKACADFLREYLPEHFPGPADMVLLGGYVLVDITLRMLAPRELARAQGFPDSYVIERGLFVQPDGSQAWKPVTKTDQVRLIGNSVCPDVAEALIRANASDLLALYAKEAA